MEKNKIFYLSLMLLVIIMTTTIAVACSDDNNEQVDVLQHENIMEEYIFLAQDGYINLSVGTAEMINGLVIHDEFIYYIFVEDIHIPEEADAYSSIIQINGIDKHGNIVKNISIHNSEPIYIDIVGFYINQSEEFIIIVQEFDNTGTRSVLYYERYNLTGDILHREELLALGNHHYGVDAHFDDSGYIAVVEFSFQNGFAVHIWDDTLAYKNNIPLVSNVFAFGTSSVFLSQAENPMAIQMINILTGEILEEHSLLLDSNIISGIYATAESSRFDYYIHTIRHLYGLNLETGELEHIIDFLESNLNLSLSPFIMVFGPEYKVVVAQKRYSTDLFNFDVEIELSVLSPVFRTTLEEIDRVVLAGFGFQSPFIDRVIDYNRRNPFQQIIIKDYFNPNSDSDFEESIVRFHLDLLAGAAPDIIWIDLLPNATGTFPRYFTLCIDDFETHIKSSLMPVDNEEILWDIINSASVHKTIDGTLLALIAESVTDYINGLQTAERTAAIIQSRVTIYLSEQRIH